MVRGLVPVVGPLALWTAHCDGVSPPSPPMSPGCTGVSGDGVGCWYLGAPGESCDATCAGHGAAYSVLTATAGDAICPIFFPGTVHDQPMPREKPACCDPSYSYPASGETVDSTATYPIAEYDHQLGLYTYVSPGEDTAVRLCPPLAPTCVFSS